MSDLYPLLMTPSFDPRPWGTRDLSPIYPNHQFAEKIGEAWLTGDDCRVANGAFRGQSLSGLAGRFKRDLVGDAAPEDARFPLLLKFLFPHEKLSVQVHPDDRRAHEVGEPWGKTECWYVAHARTGAQIGLGLRPGVTREQFARAIQEKKAEELLNWMDVFAGDMVYVAGGTVHTLGPGAIIVETQQQSDTTYRLYDYGRPRELHLERGLAAIKEDAHSGKVARPVAANGSTPLITAPYFKVDRFDLRSVQSFPAGATSGKSSVQILVAVEGCGVIEAQDCDPVTMTKGDAVVVPAVLGGFSVRPQWQVEFLKAAVPGAVVAEPEVMQK